MLSQLRLQLLHRRHHLPPMVSGPQISCKAQSSASQVWFTAVGAAGGQADQQERPPSYRAYIDFRALKADLDRHVQNCSDRNSAGDPKAVAQLYDEWVAAQSKVEQLREERNANAQSMQVCNVDTVITGSASWRGSTYGQPLTPSNVQNPLSLTARNVLAYNQTCVATPFCGDSFGLHVAALGCFSWSGGPQLGSSSGRASIDLLPAASGCFSCAGSTMLSGRLHQQTPAWSCKAQATCPAGRCVGCRSRVAWWLEAACSAGTGQAGPLVFLARALTDPCRAKWSRSAGRSWWSRAGS